MAVQLKIEYEKLIELVEQLPDEQKENLLHHLLKHKKNLSGDERKQIFQSMSVDLGAIQPEYSDSRQDWYDDDGR